MVTALAFRGFKYYFGESLKSLWYNKLMALTSVITVTGCLLLFGFFVLIASNVSHLTTQIEEQCEIQAFIDMGYTEDEEQTVFEKVKALANVKEVTLETKQQAFDNYKETLEEDSLLLEGIDPEDFLPSSCRVIPKNVQEVDALVAELEKVQGIDDIVSHRELIENIASVTSGVRKICVASSILLALISVFIISNTIKLDVHARKKEIHIMKYVGATDWFIRWPFIIEGIIISVIGVIVSILLLTTGFGIVLSYIPAQFMGSMSLLTMPQIMPYISIILLVFGIFMGALGSFIAVRKHLHV